MDNELTLAQALQLKRSLIRKLTREESTAKADVIFLSSERDDNGFYTSIESRNLLSEQILDLKIRINLTNVQYGIMQKIVRRDELSAELSFWKSVQKTRDEELSGGYFSRSRQVPEGETKEAAIKKSTLREKIETLIDERDNLHAEIQRINEKTKLVGTA